MIKESRDGYQQLGIQVAELITAIASVLQKSNHDEIRVMQGNVDGLIKCACRISNACVALNLEPPACSKRSMPL
jgi:hypothetical protein